MGPEIPTQAAEPGGVETVDLLERLGMIELNFTKAHQPVGMLLTKSFDAVKVLGINQQKRETVIGIELHLIV